MNSAGPPFTNPRCTHSGAALSLGCGNVRKVLDDFLGVLGLASAGLTGTQNTLVLAVWGRGGSRIRQGRIQSERL